MTRSQDLIQIGEFAKLADTNLRTLRYYEELGLIMPAARSEGGFRYYEKAQLDRMGAIKRLQELGLSLKEIAAAITTDAAQAHDVIARLRGLLERQIELTDAKIRRMQHDLDDLQSNRTRLLEMCADCDRPLAREQCDPCPRDQQPLPATLRALL